MIQRSKAHASLAYVIMAICLLVALWSAITVVFSVPSYLLPSPLKVIEAFDLDLRYFLWHTWVTACEALAGLLLAIVGGLLVAVVLVNIESVRLGFVPILIAAQAIPVVAVAPVFTLWFGIGFASKAAMAAFLCWFPTVMNATRGFLEVDPLAKAVFEVYRATRLQTFMKLRLPSGISFVISGIRISAGLAMIGAIVAEYVGADQGLGYVITQATYRVDTDRLFAAVLCGAISGVLIAEGMYSALAWLFRSYVRR